MKGIIITYLISGSDNMDSSTIPVWSLTDIFTGFEDPAYNAMCADLEKGVKELHAMLEKQEGSFTGRLTEIIELYNDTGAMFEELFSFAYCIYTTDTSNPEALKQINRIEAAEVGFNTFKVKLRNFIAADKPAVDKAVNESSYLAQFTFFFDEQIQLQKHQMSPEMEELAADLGRSGAGSWERLQETLSSSETIIWDEETGEQKTSVQLRSFIDHPDEEVRRKAWEKEIQLWKRIETPLAFALNGVKGASGSVNRRRGYSTTLERSTEQARISGATLDSLISVMEKSLPLFRRYLKLKAGLLGKQKIAFYDLFAPVSGSAAKRSFTEAADFIVKQFNGFSTELGSFAQNAFDRSWIDALPRQGKIGGAYCTGFHKSGVSRILCNFNGSFSALSTVAHELGHAYHHFILKDAPEIYRDYPMTLAETASIFCETIVLEGALKEASKEEQIELIEHELLESTQIVVDILSRFIFEKAVFARREQGELSAADFCRLMLDAQRQTYGDAMDDDLRHPYMWAVKGHYYRQELGFYNFPYAFGKLFGLGLYTQYKNTGAGFIDTYKKILAMTGNATAEDVTKSAGYDITTEDFWKSSIDIIESRVNQFEQLCGEMK